MVRLVWGGGGVGGGGGGGGGGPGLYPNRRMGREDGIRGFWRGKWERK